MCVGFYITTTTDGDKEQEEMSVEQFLCGNHCGLCFIGIVLVSLPNPES